VQWDGYCARLHFGQFCRRADAESRNHVTRPSGGAGRDQIQLSLGHASIKTTEKYLGVTQDLIDAPCDRLGLKLSG